jgi:hypothetical protein
MFFPVLLDKTCFKYKSTHHRRSDIDDVNNERTKVETSNEKVQTVYKDQIPRGPEAIATDTDGYVYAMSLWCLFETV